MAGRVAGFIVSLVFAASVPAATPAPQAGNPVSSPVSDIPDKFVPSDAHNDYVKRVVMIPMRDGVKLYTVIVFPKGTRDAPIVLTRTPYDAADRVENDSPKLLSLLSETDQDFVRAGYIRVFQDIRGKYGSEGVYEMTRPPRGALNSTATDDTTDAWDTIDWLVKNTPESSGKVGMFGSSYEGFTVVMALLDPHPALKVAAPESPMVDGWMGDDWYHYGAFRQINLDFITMQTEKRGKGAIVPRNNYDDYTEFLEAGSPGAYAASNGFDQFGFWKKMLAHPSYDSFWQGLDLVRSVVAHPSSVPTLWEQGLWDQEDMWGANHAYAALKAAGHESSNYLVFGPWYHSQANHFGWNTGPFRWSGDSAEQFRHDIVLPFFNQYLKDGPNANLPHVLAYNPAEGQWQHFDTWPTACEKGCSQPLQALYLQADFALSFDRPRGSLQGDAYVSDPARPVPFIPRPLQFGNHDAWKTYLVHDQRFVDDRPDVLSYQTAPLTAAVKIQGAPIADIVAATTGTDGDFVVKLIDVYPAMYTPQPELGGYELPVAMDIFRGRYRASFEHPAAIPAGKPQRYRFALPNQNYTFLPGHRIMVQIQSTLFPLYDRNPQTFIDNPLVAKPADYHKATVTVLHSGDAASAVWLPVVP